VHAGCVEPIFEAVLANDPSRITPAAATQRMEVDLFVPELPHWLYRGDTPLHLAAAGLRPPSGASSTCWSPPERPLTSRTAAE
jgi:hypothetical protein